MNTSRGSRAKELFLDALELPPGERSAHLDTACAGDTELRARVDALLAAHGSADARLGAPLVQPPAGGGGGSPDRSGEAVGPYRLEQLVGEGGFGVVYRATQTEPVRRTVAVKILKPGMDTRAVIARFEAERQALALMDHPNIARVFDAGETERGHPYFVMEFVPGVPITQACADADLDLDRRLALVQQVCEAIQHAHAKGVIHRDIKPGNVLVSESDGKLVPKVIDFGVAKAAGADLAGASLVTGAGHLLGTPAYMSPEQAGGEADLDTRSDVYALGLLLYELVAGAPPFDAAGVSFTEMQRRVREDDPPRPSVRRAQLPVDRRPFGDRPLPADLDWIVLRCLEKERGRRYPAAAALAQDLERFRDDLPVDAAPPSSWYRVRKLARRHRGATVAVLGLALALVVGAAGAGFGLLEARRANEDLDDALELARDEAQRAREAERQAARDAEDARRQFAITKEVLGFLNDDLFGAAAPTGEPGHHRDVRVREVLDIAARSLDEGERFADAPQVEAAVRQTLGQIYASLGLFDASEHHYRVAAGRLEDVDPLGTLHLDRARADVLRRDGRLVEAERLLLEVLEQTAELDTPESLHALAALRVMAGVEVALGRHVEGLERGRRALALAEEHHGPLHDATVDGLATVGLLYGLVGELSRAAEHLERTVATREARGDADTASGLVDRLNLANALRGLGRYEDALPEYQTTVVGLCAVLGPEHPDTLAAEHSLARLEMDLGRYEAAEERLERAVAGLRRRAGPDHGTTLETQAGLGRVLELTGRLTEAEALYRDAWERSRAGLSAEHPDTLARGKELGSVLHALGRLDEARTLMQEVWEAEREVRGPTHAVTLQSLGNLAIVTYQSGDVGRAGELFRVVVDELEAAEGPDSVRTLEARSNLSAYLAEVADWPAAEAQGRECVARGEQVLHARSLDLATHRIRWGMGLLGLERFEEAEPVLLAAREVLAEDYEPHWRTAESLEKLVMLYDRWGREAEAERYHAELEAWMARQPQP